jgi:predicted RNA methylase
MDLDRYYTPHCVASELINVAAQTLASPRVIADTACGDGNLLSAAQQLLRQVTCVGTDSDRNAIRRLRAKNPDWLLSVADVLDGSTFARVKAVVDSPACDLLMLNPPFSMSRNKNVEARFEGEHLRSSVAMAHVLRSVDTFKPAGGAIAIVPESLFFSELDKHARILLATHYDIKIIRGLSNSTFRGARANALIVRWLPKTKIEGTPVVEAEPSGPNAKAPVVIRGGLPLFESVGSRKGIPLVHSTDLATLAETRRLDDCRRVKAIKRGVVQGPVLLLPRVGVPLREQVSAINLRRPVQLSDCVFALRFPSLKRARIFRDHVLKYWDVLVGQYHGTGARYISVQRMRDWVEATAHELTARL